MRKLSICSSLRFLLACSGLLNLGLQAGEVRFQTSDVEISEGVGIVVVPVERTSTAAGEQITIRTSDDSAIAGTDYGMVDEIYTFDEGETEISIAVRIFDNTVFQSDRAFLLVLSDPVGIDLGTPSTVNLVIADNDTNDGAGRGAAGTTLLQGTFCLAMNGSGSTVVGGAFSTFNGELRNNIVRLLPDETLDPGFDVGTGPNNDVVAMAVDANEQIIIGGLFTEIDGVGRNGIARLNPNGALDTQFDPGSGANGLVESVDILDDGRVLMAGAFSTVNSVGRTDVALLSANGSLDNSFNVVTPQSFIGHVVKQSGGQVLLGGEVDKDILDANVTNSLMRFSMSGVRDTDFEVSVGSIFFNRVSGIAVQPDGKIVIVGLFSSVNGVASSCVARLNPDGSYDDTFDIGAGANNWVVRVTLQSDGKILLGGFFNMFDGIQRSGVVRLNSDGSVDTTFDPGLGADNVCYVAQQVVDGSIVLTGEFNSFDGYDRFRFARLNANGSLNREPLVFDGVTLQSATDLKVQFSVEPGRNFRLIETDDFGIRISVLTNKTARRSAEIVLPISADKKFFYVEQGY